MSQYKTGTVTATPGSPTITGSGTLFVGNVSAGQVFSPKGSGVPFIVGSVDSNTQITLASNYAGVAPYTGAGLQYAITSSYTPNQALPYPELGDIDTATIVKRAMLLIDAKLGNAIGGAGQANRVVFTDANGNLSTNANLASSGSNLIVGGVANQSTALIGARVAGNAFEFGHNNPAGYGSVVGAQTGDGKPFIALNGEHGTITANTYKSRGIRTVIIRSDISGGLEFGNVASANADNQAFVTLMNLASNGALSVNGAGTFTGLLQVGAGIQATGPATLAAAYGGGPITYESPFIRWYIGDGTGYGLKLAKRVASVTTDYLSVLDSGVLAMTKASAGDVITFSNGAASPVTGYLASDNVQATFFNGSAQSGEGVKLDSQSHLVRLFCSNTEVVRVQNGLGRYLVFDGSASNPGISVSAGHLLMKSPTTIGTSEYSGTCAFVVDATQIGSGNGASIKTAGNVNQCWEMWNADTTGNNIFATFLTEAGGTSRGSISYNRGGGLTAYNTTSGADLKNIFGDADPQISLDILRGIKMRSYAWKDDATQKRQIGPIADELIEMMTGAVMEKETLDGMFLDRQKMIDRAAFSNHLVVGWQNHDARLKVIEQRLGIS